MARSQSSKGNTALIRRALATAQREIDRAERNVHTEASRYERLSFNRNDFSRQRSRSQGGQACTCSDRNHEGAEQAPERTNDGPPARGPSSFR
jgi:hypothetical protein